MVCISLQKLMHDQKKHSFDIARAKDYDRKERVIELGRENKNNVLQRLKRIEGQIKGVQRMVDDEEPCAEILTQIAAARGALAQVGKAVFNRFSTTCIREALDKGKSEEEALKEMLEVLDRLLK